MKAFVLVLYKNHISSSEENAEAQLKRQERNENGILKKKKLIIPEKCMKGGVEELKKQQ